MSNWLKESEAAERLNKERNYMRRQVKSGRWPIAYFTLTGRSFQYLEKDINKWIERNSTIIKNEHPRNI